MIGIHKKIGKKSFKESYSRTKGWFFSGVAGSVVTFLFAYNYFHVPLWVSILIGFGTILTVFLFLFFVNYNRIYSHEKKKLNFDNVYGEAILILNDAFSRIHEIRKMQNPNPQIMIDSLTYLCGKLKEIFDKKTSTNCSVCIKVISDDSNVGTETELITLCRDPETAKIKKRTMVDTTAGVTLNIFKNTCFINFFNYLGQNRGNFYLNNNLPEDKGYANTSFQLHGDVPDTADTKELRDKYWTLPYKSEIVVPISPYNHVNTTEKTLLYGFLCVDSSSTEIFNTNYDVGILRGVADGIFDIINMYIQSKKNDKTGTN